MKYSDNNTPEDALIQHINLKHTLEGNQENPKPKQTKKKIAVEHSDETGHYFSVLLFFFGV